MRRKLPEVMCAVGVALDNSGAVGRCSYVPADIADLRSDFCGLEYHLHRFLYKGDLITLYLDVGVGVLLVDNAL